MEITTYRKLIFHLPPLKEVVINTLRVDLKNNKIWITMEETDARKNSITNVLVRALKPDEVSSFLLYSKWLTVTNANAIMDVIKDAVGHWYNRAPKS